MTVYDLTRHTALTAERRTVLDNAKAIVTRAQTAGRDLDGAENAAVESGFTRIKAIDVELREQSAAMVRAIHSLGSADDFNADGSPVGGVFSDADRASIISAVKSRTMFRTEVPAKAALMSTLVPAAGLGIAPGVYPGTAFPISSLFANEVAAGPVQRFYQMGTATAAVVAELAAKPDSGLTVTAVDVALKKIATITKFSDEFSDDAPGLMAHLASELTSAVVVAENTSVLATFAGTSGIVTATGTTATGIDVVGAAIAVAEATNGVTPTAIVVNPTVLGTLRAAKASTGGGYFLDPVAAGPTTLHGVPLVPTAATAAGTAWLVTAPGVVIYRRGGITAEIGWDGNDFTTNVRTLRVEERFATAVLRPGFLTKITLT